ncbi:MAG: zinc ribbon domain-containing protein [Lentisphaerae bacterium]|nr:zinc ribbon domain-containing protein [Lentisphaerota bacterium]
MPIYEYQSVESKHSCVHCRTGFDHFHKSPGTLEVCPECGAAVKKLVSAPNVGGSESGADDRAKSAGFHKLKKVSTGEYEKLY